MDRRILLTLVAIIIVGGIFFVVRSQTSHHTAQNLTFDLRVKGDNMVPDTISATQGDTITLSVASDRAFELHVHGVVRQAGVAVNLCDLA